MSAAYFGHSTETLTRLTEHRAAIARLAERYATAMLGESDIVRASLARDLSDVNARAAWVDNLIADEKLRIAVETGCPKPLASLDH